MTNSPFLGLTMSVFSAFSFLGDDKAVTYALGQMEQFVDSLHSQLSHESRTIFPNRGVDTEAQSAFLSRGLQPTEDVYITFHARPSALRIAINITDRVALNKAARILQQRPDDWLGQLTDLGDGWELRASQMEFNPETGETIHYKDLFRDRVTTLNAEESAELIDRLVYLNGEAQWIAPLTLTKTLSSEFVAAMGTTVTFQMTREVEEVLPLLRLLTGGTGSRAGQRRTALARTTRSRQRAAGTSASEVATKGTDQFTYNAVLKPLHIRKGFINMTATHWPFFSVNSRTEVRPVSLKYDGHTDKKSAVWRMLPNDTARLVLSDQAQRWLENNFSSEDEIQIAATKTPDNQIEIALTLISDTTG